eukprot:m.261110 g.261110  ORF g.261110 m.261110 type:complete len:68 (+) comp43186_c0_seq1:1054-1257(+)
MQMPTQHCSIAPDSADPKNGVATFDAGADDEEEEDEGEDEEKRNEERNGKGKAEKKETWKRKQGRQG